MVDINSRQSIVAIVFLAVIGPCVFILQPGFIQGLVEHMGLTEVQAAEVAFMEMLGLASTTVLLSFISSKVRWRRFTMFCIAVCTIGNLASIGQTDYETLAAIRFLTGLGSGGIISLTFKMMGLTTRADRNFGYIIVWVLTYGAFGMLSMPTVFASVGMNGLLVFFALFCAAGFYFLRYLPDAGPAHTDIQDAKTYSIVLKGISLFALLLYNIGIGIVWVYLFLVGLETGMSEQAVAYALTVSQFLGIAGAFLAVMLEVRIGRLLPLAIGVVGGSISVYLLVGEIGVSRYWLAVCAFNFLWNLSMPYLLATLAQFDASGRMVVHGVSMQFIGYAVGPWAAAQLLVEFGGYDAVNFTAAVLFFAAAVFLIPGLRAQHARMRAVD